MKIKSVKGTMDYLPREAALRERVERTILGIYRKNGFQRIITPAIEDIENLEKSDGGDNLNLMFRILKRGDKLESALSSGGELCDMGLRYDLTLPLSRYFCANREKLPMPFKCIQIDKSYRAERPQKGRLREFTQCDIDVIGDGSADCETELIAVTAEALLALDIGGFTIRINDRKVLNGLLKALGFEESMLPTVCVSFDKLDKIGAQGVAEELIQKGCDKGAVDKLSELLGTLPITPERAAEIIGDPSVTDGLCRIIRDSLEIAGGRYNIEFDISLVRGQGYYTGTVFEVKSEKFGSSVAGGGRYDGLISKFTGESIPACGFSIGFERIFSILSEQGAKASDKELLALLYEGDFASAYSAAAALKETYEVTLYRKPKKMKAFLDRLSACGYVGFADTKGNIKRFSDN